MVEEPLPTSLELLALAGDLDLNHVLQRILRTARTLARARYGALGIPDGAGGFGRFITVGISERRASSIGDLPRVHGVLGALLEDGRAIRLSDIRLHPKFAYYPSHHPVLIDFLGVPIKHRGEILGNLYLSGSRLGRFSARDQRTVETLAAYAGVAIANANLLSQSQALAIMEERNRVAQELHDAVSQTLFSMVYEARAAGLKDGLDPQARGAFRRLEEGAAAALKEMRSLVYALRPKSLERDGLTPTLREHAAAMGRIHQAAINLEIETVDGLTLAQEHALLRIGQEALHNSIKHGAGAPIRLSLRRTGGTLELVIDDQGPGFVPDAAGRPERTMGLSTMKSRAAQIRASIQIRSAPGDGCTVTVTLPSTDKRRR